jgi:hypothetical protein
MIEKHSRALVTEVTKMRADMDEIKEILAAAFPAADTRPFRERMKEATDAMMASISPEQREQIDSEISRMTLTND